MNVGFIGLGIMGRPMAEHLAAGGHSLFLHSRSGVPEGTKSFALTMVDPEGRGGAGGHP